MADLQLVVSSLDEVEESHRPLYKETDGQFQLNLNAYAEYVKKPVLSKNAELLGKIKKQQPLLEKFKDFDDDALTAFQEWRAKQAEEIDEPETLPAPKAKPQTNPAQPEQVDVDALQAKWRQDRERELRRKESEFKAQLAEKEKAIADLEGKHRQFVTRTTLTEMAMKNGVMPDRLESWLKTTADRFRLDENDVLVALDDEGDPLDIKPEKYIAENLRELYGWFYLAPEQGGSGATAVAGKGSPMAGRKRSTMNAKDKADFIRQYGDAAYWKLPN